MRRATGNRVVPYGSYGLIIRRDTLHIAGWGRCGNGPTYTNPPVRGVWRNRAEEHQEALPRRLAWVDSVNRPANSHQAGVAPGPLNPAFDPRLSNDRGG